jgi:hypothetical protein
MLLTDSHELHDEVLKGLSGCTSERPRVSVNTRGFIFRPGKTLNSAAGLPARVQIPVPPSATSRLLYELLGRVRLGFLVVSPFRIACAFLHVERGRSSKRVWRNPRIIYLFIFQIIFNRNGLLFQSASTCSIGNRLRLVMRLVP